MGSRQEQAGFSSPPRKLDAKSRVGFPGTPGAVFGALSPLHASGGAALGRHAAIGTATPECMNTPQRHSSRLRASTGDLAASTSLMASPGMFESLNTPFVGAGPAPVHFSAPVLTGRGRALAQDSPGIGRLGQPLQGDDDEAVANTGCRLIFEQDRLGGVGFPQRQDYSDGRSAEASEAGAALRHGKYSFAKLSTSAGTSYVDGLRDLPFGDHDFETATEFSEAQAVRLRSSTPGRYDTEAGHGLHSRYGDGTGIALALLAPAAPLPLPHALVASSVTSGSRRARQAVLAALPPLRPASDVTATAAAVAAEAAESLGNGQGVLRLRTSGKIRPEVGGDGYIIHHNRTGSARGLRMVDAAASQFSSLQSAGRETRSRHAEEREKERKERTAKGKKYGHKHGHNEHVGTNAVQCTAAFSGWFTTVFAPRMASVLPRAVDFGTGEVIDNGSSKGGRSSTPSELPVDCASGEGKGGKCPAFVFAQDRPEVELSLGEMSEEESDDPRRRKGGPSADPKGQGGDATIALVDEKGSPFLNDKAVVPVRTPLSMRMPMPLAVDDEITRSTMGTFALPPPLGRMPGLQEFAVSFPLPSEGVGNGCAGTRPHSYEHNAPAHVPTLTPSRPEARTSASGRAEDLSNKPTDPRPTVAGHVSLQSLEEGHKSTDMRPLEGGHKRCHSEVDEDPEPNDVESRASGGRKVFILADRREAGLRVRLITSKAE